MRTWSCFYHYCRGEQKRESERAPWTWLFCQYNASQGVLWVHLTSGAQVLWFCLAVQKPGKVSIWHLGCLLWKEVFILNQDFIKVENFQLRQRFRKGFWGARVPHVYHNVHWSHLILTIVYKSSSFYRKETEAQRCFAMSKNLSSTEISTKVSKDSCPEMYPVHRYSKLNENKPDVYH